MKKNIAKTNNEIVEFFKENGFDIPNVPTNRKYWLIRTEGGEWYEEFATENYVSIGWNEISDEMYCQSVNKDEAIRILEEKYPEKSQHTHTLNSIKRFYQDIKKDDVVMIPSEGSQTIKFGIVTSDVYTIEPTETQLDEGACPHFKRRDVEWIKTISKNNLDLKLFKMLQSRHTISNATDYAKEIDSSLYDFYIKGEEVSLSIFVNKKSNLSAYSLRTLTNLPWILEDVMNNTDYDLRELETTIYVKSPGKQEYIAKGKKGAQYLLGAAFVVTTLLGGSVSHDGIDFETKGLLQPFLEHIENKEKEENRHEEKMAEIENDKKTKDEKLKVEKDKQENIEDANENKEDEIDLEKDKLEFEKQKYEDQKENKNKIVEKNLNELKNNAELKAPNISQYQITDK